LSLASAIFDPTEDFLDALSDDLTDTITGMACGAPVNRCLARLAGFAYVALYGDVWCDILSFSPMTKF